jgi:arginine/lysine/ornithine decarboxylase
LDRLPLVNGLLNYINKEHSYFAMPGHKMGKGFTGDAASLFKNILKADVTELPGLDNLHNPEGIIKDAEERLSALYGSKKSYFLVNGSTSGNMIAIFSSFKEGDKVIVERSCHTSIFNGIVLRKLNPVYIYQDFDNRYNLGIELSLSKILDIIKENPDAKGIILTVPNYYGAACNLESIICEAKIKKMTVIIDGAHGAHFIASDKLPKSPVLSGADIVINSAHKTLPALTQSAYLHINNEFLIDKADFYFSVFNSTSPSYLLMASMDYSRYYLEEHKIEWDNLIERCEITRLKIENLGGYHILEGNELENSKLDRTRYLINLSSGVSAYKIKDILMNNSIEIEYNDCNNLILIFSPFNTEKELDKLFSVLKGINIKRLKEDGKEIRYKFPRPARVLQPYEAVEELGETVLLKDSLNRIVKRAVAFYPPGIPCILPGELMDIDTLNMIEYYKGNKIEALGIQQDKIDVVQERTQNE